MKKSNKSQFLKKPHKIEKRLGNFTAEAELVNVPKLSRTCTAMSSVAKEEKKDDFERDNGNDDYISSLRALFNAFDTFIREKSKNKYTPGYEKIYDLSNPNDLTIYLMWQIRNIWTHQGGVIDKNCKIKYESILNKSLKNEIEPLIDLPVKIDLEYEFTMKFKDYKIVKNLVFDYIKRKVSKEDYQILWERSVSVFTWDKGHGYLKCELGILEVDIDDAIKCGYKFDFDNMCLDFPPDARFNPKLNKIIVRSDHKSFNARLLDKKNIKDKMKIKLYSKAKVPLLRFGIHHRIKKKNIN